MLGGQATTIQGKFDVAFSNFSLGLHNSSKPGKGGFSLIDNFHGKGQKIKFSAERNGKYFPFLISTFLYGQERKSVCCRHGGP